MDGAPWSKTLNARREPAGSPRPRVATPKLTAGSVGAHGAVFLSIRTETLRTELTIKSIRKTNAEEHRALPMPLTELLRQRC